MGEALHMARSLNSANFRAAARDLASLSSWAVADTDQQLIDVHAHFLTESYVSAARAAGHVHPDGMAGWPKWSADEHLRLMDRWGVATAMLSISSPGTYFGDDAAARRLTREVNEGGAAISRAHPGRFGHLQLWQTVRS